MSDKTENHTSELPDAHGGRLEENPGTGLLHVKEEDETDDMNSHQTEIHWSLPADEDNADIVKVEITEDLCVTRQLGDPDENTSDSISPDEDNADIVKVEITEDLCVTRQLGDPDENTSDSISPDEDNTDIVKEEITEDLCVRYQMGTLDLKNSGSISPGKFVSQRDRLQSRTVTLGFLETPLAAATINRSSCSDNLHDPTLKAALRSSEFKQESKSPDLGHSRTLSHHASTTLGSELPLLSLWFGSYTVGVFADQRVSDITAGLTTLRR
ncbi:uncharacterized protein LOC128657904 [Bombina bombina]|uniref:uncharacterized protein LOC128657904 n=1 Tax=Bombina bombina TaxID=8345 RepID=UPI00235B1C02|nr:uncharacterized protein LOC128657904 [Bombina bombina]